MLACCLIRKSLAAFEAITPHPVMPYVTLGHDAAPQYAHLSDCLKATGDAVGGSGREWRATAVIRVPLQNYARALTATA